MNSVLIKLSGEYLFGGSNSCATKTDIGLVQSVVSQLKILLNNHKIGIVIGGGNFFRASKQGKDLGLRQSVADSAGMLATVMNGLIFQDFCAKYGIRTEILSAFEIPGVVQKISNELIDKALADNKIIIFVGGTGNPFFTTDTCAVLRALQIGATQVWKATNVDGVYESDPKNNANAKILKAVTYSKFMEQGLEIMDLTAISLAKKYDIKIKVFNLFAKDALICAANDVNFGSSVE